MAIRTFNSVAGFSVGEVPVTIVTATGNVTTGNLLTDNLLHSDGTPWDFITASGSANYIQFSNGTDLTSSANLQFDNANANLNVIGNINVGSGSNIKLYSNGTLSANVINSNTFNGNFAGNIANIGGNLNVIFNYSGNLTSNVNLQYDPTINALFAANSVTSNYFKGKFDSTSSSQPNITSLGNLTGLQVGNNTTTGKVILDTNGNVNAINVIASGSVNAVDATFTGNLTVSGTTTFVNTQTTSIKDPLILLGGASDGGNISSNDGKDRGLLLDNYDDTLGAPVNQAFVWKTANSQFEAVANVTVLNNVITVNEYANIKANIFKGNLVATNITGTITATSSSQPNIHSLGVLTSVEVSGLANVNQLKVGTVTYPNTSGAEGQYLRTHSDGTVYYSSLDTSKVANGATEIDLLQDGNINFTVDGVTNVVVFSTDGLTVDGNANVYSNVNVSGSVNVDGEANVGSVIIGNSSIYSTTLTTTSTTTTTLASIDKTTFRGVEFIIKGENTTSSKFSVNTLLAVHDNASTPAVDFTSYGLVSLGGSTGTFSMTSDTNNIYLKVTPAMTDSTVWTTQYRLI